MTARAWVDGAFVCEADALVPASGVFETMGVFDGGLPLWERHRARLTRSADAVGLRVSLDDDLRDVGLALASANGHGIVRVAVGTTAGPALVITTRARDGATEPLVLVEAQTARPAGAHDQLKVAARAWLREARAAAQAQGAHDAVAWRDGMVLEATAYNLFAVVGDALVTPPSDAGVLPGIAREVVLEQLARAGRPARVAPLPLADLRASPALFVTNAVYGPRRARLAGRGGEPSPWDAALAAAWARGLR